MTFLHVSVPQHLKRNHVNSHKSKLTTDSDCKSLVSFMAVYAL